MCAVRLGLEEAPTGMTMLPATVETVSVETNPTCPVCSSVDVWETTKRYNASRKEIVQVYRCKKCRTSFSAGREPSKWYPKEVREFAIQKFVDEGLNTREILSLVQQVYPNQKTISIWTIRYWLSKYTDIRKRAKEERHSIKTLVCAGCGKTFEHDPHYKKSGELQQPSEFPRYCSPKCRTVIGSPKVRRERRRGRFAISKEALTKAFFDDGLSLPDTAKRFGVSWWTVYRRMRDFGIERSQGARKMTASLDMTAFVLTVNPLHGSDLSTALKELQKQLPFNFNIRLYDSTYRNPKSKQ